MEAISELMEPAVAADTDSPGFFARMTNNQLFSAGFGLAAIGAAAKVARQGSGHGIALLKRK